MITLDKDIKWLETGTEQQVQIYNLIQELELVARLQNFIPKIVGEYLLGLANEQSTLYVCCEVYANESFKSTLETSFGTKSKFKIVEKVVQGVPGIICRFKEGPVKIKIVGLPKPVRDHLVYQYYLAEKKLLSLKNDETTAQKLKEAIGSGLSTEQAFCSVFRIEGDPSEVLPNLLEEEDEQFNAEQLAHSA